MEKLTSAFCVPAINNTSTRKLKKQLAKLSKALTVKAKWRVEIN